MRFKKHSSITLFGQLYWWPQVQEFLAGDVLSLFLGHHRHKGRDPQLVSDYLMASGVRKSLISRSNPSTKTTTERSLRL